MVRQQKRTATGNQRGFTLIELLVVVAIIALLISILFPALAAARAQARATVCMTNERTLGQGAVLYSHDNDGYIPRGIQSANGAEYALFSTAVLPYVGHTSFKMTFIQPNGQPQTIQWNGDTLKLWPAPDQNHPGNMDSNHLNRMLREIPEYRCPDYPEDVKSPVNEAFQTGRNPFDFCVSAFSIPYTAGAFGMDHEADLQWSGQGFRGENPARGSYVQASRPEDFPAGVSPSDLVYITEVSTDVPWRYSGSTGPRFHTFWLGSQLPFAGLRRIANDMRHPGGLNALSFDGHARMMTIQEMDPGWPTPLDVRLRWFTSVPQEVLDG